MTDVHPDNPPGAYPDDAPENLVGIHMGGEFYLYLLHFMQDSIPTSDKGNCEPDVPGVPCVEPGAVLPAGTYLGVVGNSGTTLEPHLHVTYLWYDAEATPPRSWSVPSELATVWVSSAVDQPAEPRDFAVPQTGEWIADAPFTVGTP